MDDKPHDEAGRKMAEVEAMEVCDPLSGVPFPGSPTGKPLSGGGAADRGRGHVDGRWDFSGGRDISGENDVSGRCGDGREGTGGNDINARQDIGGNDISGRQDINSYDVSGSDIGGNDISGRQDISSYDVSGRQDISGSDIGGRQDIGGSDIGRGRDSGGWHDVSMGNDINRGHTGEGRDIGGRSDIGGRCDNREGYIRRDDIGGRGDIGRRYDISGRGDIGGRYGSREDYIRRDDISGNYAGGRRDISDISGDHLGRGYGVGGGQGIRSPQDRYTPTAEEPEEVSRPVDAAQGGSGWLGGIWGMFNTEAFWRLVGRMNASDAQAAEEMTRKMQEAQRANQGFHHATERVFQDEVGGTKFQLKSTQSMKITPRRQRQGWFY